MICVGVSKSNDSSTGRVRVGMYCVVLLTCYFVLSVTAVADLQAWNPIGRERDTLKYRPGICFARADVQVWIANIFEHLQ